jgi:hypothetical protein
MLGLTQLDVDGAGLSDKLLDHNSSNENDSNTSDINSRQFIIYVTVFSLVFLVIGIVFCFAYR